MQIISSRCPRVLVDIIPGRYYSIIIPSPLSAERGHETAKVLYVIIHSGSDWKGCNVIRVLVDIIPGRYYSIILLFLSHPDP